MKMLRRMMLGAALLSMTTAVGSTVQAGPDTQFRASGPSGPVPADALGPPVGVDLPPVTGPRFTASPVPAANLWQASAAAAVSIPATPMAPAATVALPVAPSTPVATVSIPVTPAAPAATVSIPVTPAAPVATVSIPVTPSAPVATVSIPVTPSAPATVSIPVAPVPAPSPAPATTVMPSPATSAAPPTVAVVSANPAASCHDGSCATKQTHGIGGRCSDVFHCLARFACYQPARLPCSCSWQPSPFRPPLYMWFPCQPGGCAACVAPPAPCVCQGSATTLAAKNFVQPLPQPEMPKIALQDKPLVPGSSSAMADKKDPSLPAAGNYKALPVVPPYLPQ
jgi:hypothetical protein